MTFDPFSNRVQFGMLTDEEKALLQSKGPWEYYIGDSWWKTEPAWVFTTVYRRAKPHVIMPTVDWSCFGPNVTAAAWSENGSGSAFLRVIPTKYGNVWSSGSFAAYEVTLLAYPPSAYNRGNCDWKDSLVIRPKEPQE